MKFFKFKKPRCLIAVFLFAFTSLVFSHKNLAFSEGVQYGDTFVAASISDPNNLIPVLATDSASQDIVGKVFNGLVRYTPELELEGDLATHWDIEEGGKVIVFYLRNDVFWHDGEPFTATDVEFTFSKLTDTSLPSPYKGDFEKVLSFKVLSDHVIRVEYKESFSPALSSWSMWIMPEHLMRGENLLRSSFSRNPIGTGPFIFNKWVTGEKVVLLANPNYHEGRPGIDRIVYRIIPDPVTSFLELNQESIDSMGLSPLQYQRQTKSHFFKSFYQKYRYPSFGYTYLGFNLKSNLFKDVRVRKAIDHAIDKKKLIKAILLGLGKTLTGPFAPESWAYNHNLEPLPYDRSKAISLLKQAGWIDSDGNGILDKEGQEFNFTIVTNHGNYQRQQSAEMIQQYLSEVGIGVEIKVIEWSAFLEEVVGKRDFDAVILGWGLSRDPDPHDIWHSSKTGPGEFNFISYSNEEVDLMIDEGRKEFDQDTRKDIYHQIHRLIYDDQPVVFLFTPDALPIIHNRFENVHVTPLGLGYDFIRWWVKESNRKYKRFKL